MELHQLVARAQRRRTGKGQAAASRRRSGGVSRHHRRVAAADAGLRKRERVILNLLHRWDRRGAVAVGHESKKGWRR